MARSLEVLDMEAQNIKCESNTRVADRPHSMVTKLNYGSHLLEKIDTLLCITR